MIFMLVLGCADTPTAEQPVVASDDTTTDTVGDTVVEEEPPSEYVYEEEDVDDGGPLLSVGEVEEGLREVMEVLTWVDPQELTRVYNDQRIQNGDSDCPYYLVDASGETYYGYDYWSDSCTADSGGAFSGYGYSYDYEPYLSGTTWYHDYAYANVFGTITDRLGESLELAGSFYHYSYSSTDTPDAQHGYAYLIGDARWNSGDAEGSWLDQEYSLDMTYSWNWYDSSQSFTLDLDGSVSGLSGGVNSALVEDFFLYSEGLGSECTLEPAGRMSVRDAEGEWYHVEFQGPAWWGAPVFPPDCDGCGQVYYRGEHIGDACPDLSVLFTWQGRPWLGGQ